MTKPKKKAPAKRRGAAAKATLIKRAKKVAAENPVALGRKAEQLTPDRTLHASSGKLPPRWQRFVDEYLKDLNGNQAAIRAGYSPHTARQTAYDLLKLDVIKAAVDAAIAERQERTQDDQDTVLERLRSMVDADPTEITRIEQHCCRYCWGKDNRYQYTTAEMQLERGAFERKLRKDRPELDKPDGVFMLEELMADFDGRGGIGFDPTLDPNPECEECGGRGVDEVVFADTRTLSAGAKLLFQGVKRTEKGLEVKLQSQFEALVKLGLHAGMFAQRHKVGGDPDNDSPINAGFAFIPPKADPGDDDDVGKAKGIDG